MVNFFAYGTLQLPEVMFAVTGQSFAFQTDFLACYCKKSGASKTSGANS